jgi:fatty acid desaturase
MTSLTEPEFKRSVVPRELLRPATLCGRAADRRIETIIATTRDNHVDWLGRLLLAPRNVGCHIVHHIHPQVGLRQLPRLREWYCEHYAELFPSPPTGSTN